MSIGPAPALAALSRGGSRLVSARLSDQLAARLAEEVERSSLAPGSRLPTEQQLALAHGVSRTVVREALHQLKSRGLVASRQGVGLFVADPDARSLAFDPEVLRSVDSFVHVVEVRRVIEGEVAALAAQRATRSQVAGLRKALAAIDAAAAAGGDGVAEDLAFHRAIGEASGNPQFGHVVAFFEQYLRQAMRITRANEARRHDFMEAVRREHRAIVDAIARHDAREARACAIEHLECGQRRLQISGLLKSPAPSSRKRPS